RCAAQQRFARLSVDGSTARGARAAAQVGGELGTCGRCNSRQADALRSAGRKILIAREGKHMDFSEPLGKGLVIPAHPLALNAQRKLDERRQRALSRYYIAAGSGGLAVGVHTTQFEIRDLKIGLFKPVLQL